MLVCMHGFNASSIAQAFAGYVYLFTVVISVILSLMWLENIYLTIIL